MLKYALIYYNILQYAIYNEVQAIPLCSEGVLLSILDVSGS